MNRNMLKVVAAIVIGLLLSTVILGEVFMGRLTDKVIERMEKPYSPSPYGPGLDPDQLDGFRATIEEEGKSVSFDEAAWTKRWEASRRDSN